MQKSLIKNLNLILPGIDRIVDVFILILAVKDNCQSIKLSIILPLCISAEQSAGGAVGGDSWQLWQLGESGAGHSWDGTNNDV